MCSPTTLGGIHLDLNTIKEIARPTSQNRSIDWREGDAWLAGGTWLFSELQPHLRRLIDLEGFGWQPLTVTERGLQIAATCPIAKLTALAAPVEWAAAALIEPCCHSFSVVVQDLEYSHRWQQRLHVIARRSYDFADRCARGHLQYPATRWRRASGGSRGFCHRQSSECVAAGRLAEKYRVAGPRAAQTIELSPHIADPSGAFRRATDRHPGSTGWNLHAYGFRFDRAAASARVSKHSRG